VREMGKKKPYGQELAKYILSVPAGPELDRFVTTLIFERKIEECPLGVDSWHVEGSTHYESLVKGEDFCGYPLPGFSTDWESGQAILEWLTARYPSVQIFWDCDHWSCNLNSRDGVGNWFRISGVPNTPGFLETLCKAALLAKVYPRDWLLEVRFKVSVPKKPRRKKNGRKKN